MMSRILNKHMECKLYLTALRISHLVSFCRFLVRTSCNGSKLLLFSNRENIYFSIKNQEKERE